MSFPLHSTQNPADHAAEMPTPPSLIRQGLNPQTVERYNYCAETGDLICFFISGEAIRYVGARAQALFQLLVEEHWNTVSARAAEEGLATLKATLLAKEER